MVGEGDIVKLSAFFKELYDKGLPLSWAQEQAIEAEFNKRLASAIGNPEATQAAARTFGRIWP